ncbi:NHLP bacteriocin system secretion protein [Massilia sp. W12]|uniref:NHLP bacteriocin system secretion protein n=1 Tax=Massilia sp. W12 TaxID=3126507 RepID=UPI0030CD494F
MKKNTIFRQVAMERLSSPEQLDSLLQVVSRRAWLALAGLALLIIMLLLWALFGSVPTKINAQQCILVKSGGVSIVASVAGGRLTDMSVERGDMVTRGQIIGRIEQLDALQKIKGMEARLKEVQAQYAQASKMAATVVQLRGNTNRQQLQGLQTRQQANANKIKLLQERLESQNNLFAQGLLTKQTVIATQLDLSAAQLDAENIKSELKQLEVRRLEEQKQSENEVTQAKNQLEDVQRQINLALREAKTSSLVVSQYTGRVLEVKVSEGQLVDRGTQLLSIEAAGSSVNEIEAYVYLPAADGKKIKPGMRVEISPSTVKREEYGFLHAFIGSVAEYPSTDQGLMRIFGNESLVKQLTGSNPPIQMVASLKPSASNPGNYEWSTRQGPPFAIQSGTLCAADITLSEQRPIALVLPFLRKMSGQ